MKKDLLFLKAFSLVEVLVSIVLLLFIAFATNRLFLNLVKKEESIFKKKEELIRWLKFEIRITKDILLSKV